MTCKHKTVSLSQQLTLQEQGKIEMNTWSLWPVFWAEDTDVAAADELAKADGTVAAEWHTK